jgi:hypothetical protein
LARISLNFRKARKNFKRYYKKELKKISRIYKPVIRLRFTKKLVHDVRSYYALERRFRFYKERVLALNSLRVYNNNQASVQTRHPLKLKAIKRILATKKSRSIYINLRKALIKGKWLRLFSVKRAKHYLSYRYPRESRYLVYVMRHKILRSYKTSVWFLKRGNYDKNKYFIKKNLLKSKVNRKVNFILPKPLKTAMNRP